MASLPTSSAAKLGNRVTRFCTLGSQVIVNENFPALLRLFESPPYAAPITALPAAVPVMFTEQVPATSVQVAEENVTFPVPETSAHVTIPVCTGNPPETTAVQVVNEPTPKENDVHDTTVDVGAFAIATVAFPELPLLWESPLYVAVMKT